MHRDTVCRATSALHFLEADHGYSLIRREVVDDSYLVRYESGRVFVQLSVLPPDFEAHLSFGRIGIDEEPNGFSFEIGDFQLAQPEEFQKWVSGMGCRSGRHIEWLADALRTFGVRCLSGLDTAFTELRENRIRFVDAARRDEYIESVRHDGNAAWNMKDYSRVITLYNQIKSELSELEKKRLRYAECHVIVK